MRPLGDCLLDGIHLIEELQLPPRRGFHTGLSGVDGLSPWRTARLTILSGRASVGKTGFLLRSALESARGGVSTAVFTGDGTCASIGARLLTAAGDLRVPRGVPGAITRERWARMTSVADELARLPLWIGELRPYEPDAVRAAIEDAAKHGRASFVAFDGIPWSRASITSTMYELAEAHRLPILAAVRDDGELIAPRTIEPLRFAAPSWTTVLQLEQVGSGPEPGRADLALLVCDNDGNRYENVPLVLDKPIAWVREARSDERPPVEI
jgi:hypothetical protein